MSFFRGLAYEVYVGAFPMVAIIGFATYATLLITAGLVSAKRYSKGLHRVPVKVHRWLAIAAIVLATLHLLMGVSTYV